ncbi:MAG: hypothetical protein HYS44_00535 [Candidatus Niyogibacteria bacterium]|nr:hypothetical protein [Candidatus Niyogibacteria bacterium]
MPNKLLGGDTPRERIERGDAESVEMIIEQMKSGAYA